MSCAVSPKPLHVTQCHLKQKTNESQRAQAVEAFSIGRRIKNLTRVYRFLDSTPGSIPPTFLSQWL